MSEILDKVWMPEKIYSFYASMPDVCPGGRWGMWDERTDHHPKIAAQYTRSDIHAKLEERLERGIAATINLCSCGGKGPNEKDVCDACKIYHTMMGKP